MRATDLGNFVGWAIGACLNAPPNTHAIIVVDDDDPDGMLCLGVPMGETPPDTEGMFLGREYIAMATRTRWSPDDVTDFVDSWLLVCVRRHETATFVVGPVEGGEDGTGWSRIRPTDAPWFALSIAGSLRKALDGEPLVWKESSDRRLFHKIGEGEAPPVDAEGRI